VIHRCEQLGSQLGELDAAGGEGIAHVCLLG
jgi:hypothetical protein